MEKIQRICSLVLLAAFWGCVPVLHAQSFDKLWKQVEQAQEKSLPQTVIKLTDEIFRKGEREKNTPQMLKAYMCRNTFQNVLTPDSLYVNLKGLEQWALREQNPVSRAVLNSLVASIYANYADNNRWELRNRTSLNLGEMALPADIREWSANLFVNQVIKYTGEDRYIAGQAVPKTILGSNISFRYKDFDVSLQINGAFGHKVYNGTSLTYMNMNSFPDYNVMKKAPAQNIKDQTATDYWLEDGDYINFDYVTLGWNVPLKNTRYLQSLRLSLTVNNLATISGYSGLTPMINSSSVNATLGIDDKRNYPLYRIYTIGLSVNF